MRLLGCVMSFLLIEVYELRSFNFQAMGTTYFSSLSSIELQTQKDSEKTKRIVVMNLYFQYGQE